MTSALKLRAIGRALVPSFGLTLVFLSACGSGGGGSSKPHKGNVVIEGSNNYTATSTMTIPTMTTKSGADLKISWDKLSQDFLCHSVDPTKDIRSVAFASFVGSSKDDISKQISDGEDPSPKTYKQFLVQERDPGATSTSLSQLKGQGGAGVTPASDYAPDSDTTYMMFFYSGTVLGTGGRTMFFLEPSASSDVTEVSAPDGCNMLKFTAHLADKKKVDIPADGPWVLDWSSLTKDGLSNKVYFQKIDSLMFARYKGKSAQDLESEFLDLEVIPDESYEMTFNGEDADSIQKSADLADAKDKDGKSFSGFQETEGSTWLVALRCSSCMVPAPIAVSVFNVTK